MTPQTENDWFSERASTFGDRLAGAREAAGLGQKELARHLGIKQATLQKWEEDLSEPRANKLSMVSGLLNVSISWLLMGQGDGPSAPIEEPGKEGLSAVVLEMRSIRASMQTASDRLTRLEKQLSQMSVE